MRTTTRLCAGLLVLAGLVSPPLAAAGTMAGAARAILESAHVGQFNPAQTAQSATPQPGGDLRASSDRLIVTARLALAVGDARRASELVSEAELMQVPYGSNSDSPARVRDMIARWEQSNNEMAAGKTGTAKLHRAALMVEQADWLRLWDKLDEAERLAMDADTIGATFGVNERNPKAVLQDVYARRQQTQTGPYKIWDGTTPRQAMRDPNVVPVSGEGPAPSTNETKATASAMLFEARKALSNGNVVEADALARQAATMPVQYVPGEDHPQAVLMDVARVRAQMAGGNNAIRPVSSEFVVPGAPMATDPSQMTQAMVLFKQGEEALRAGQTAQALELYRMANAQRDGLDPFTQKTVRERLNLIAAAGVPGQGPAPGATPENMLTEADAARQVLINQVSAEVTRKQIEAGKMKGNDPVAALALLEETRRNVEQTQLDQRVKDTLIRRLDFEITDLKKLIEFTGPERKLNAQNAAVESTILREQEHKVQVGNELAQLCEQFNQAMDAGRFNDAELIARRAELLAPEEPVVQSMIYTSKFMRRRVLNETLASARERGVAEALREVEEASVPHHGSPFQFGPVQDWKSLTARRGALDRQNERMTDRELEIKKKLQTPVSLQFTNKPLGEVVQHLAQLAAINIHLDPQGLSDEGVTTSTPISISIKDPISLKSTLDLVLGPLKLTHVIKSEVLMITSKQLGDGEVYAKAYNVADLVIPIPNFVASGNMGLASALQGALGDAGRTLGTARGLPPEMAVATPNGGTTNAAFTTNGVNGNVLQQPGGGMGGVPGQPGGGSMGAAGLGTGPAGLGSGVAPDFDSLIDLVTSTIKPESWREVGGPGSIQGREQNLTLIVSQTQAVHEQIADLLQQLRRLQDLQVTIEVRFITLSDSFFERIGIDFDFEIDDDTDRPFQTFGQVAPNAAPTYNATGVTTNPPRDFQDRDHGKRNVTVGMQAPGVFNADLDIPVTQGSFPLAVPQFGGFAPGAGTQLGFAILSDIESYFFIEASQGDRRSNVLQAPKVTLFNGQIAFVADVSQSPFVISVIPVVGDFAAAFQPVIVVLSEGTFLTVQAVVSPDRRFVRLTLVPFFSSIGDVDTFTFTGSSTTTTSTKKGEGDDDEASSETDTSVSRSGTSVQLPTFAFVTVTTTVSVPDGGTVLLGGIKRLSEGRNEFGTPILNKIPYLNRLFSNVGIGRETSSLMMMVTPRIIIQEEEEALLLGGSGEL